jgi:hypothetical protein
MSNCGRVLFFDGCLKPLLENMIRIARDQQLNKEGNKMAEIAKGKIEELKTFGPQNGTYGEFYNLRVTVNGEQYGKILKDKDKELVKGDTVNILYQSKAGKDGKVYKNIVTIDKIEESQPTTIVSFKDYSPTIATVSSEDKKTATSSKGKDNTAYTERYYESREDYEKRQKRIGRSHAITTAVSLLKELNFLEGGAQFENVIDLANQVLKYTETGE